MAQIFQKKYLVFIENEVSRCRKLQGGIRKRIIIPLCYFGRKTLISRNVTKCKKCVKNFFFEKNIE